MAIDDVKANGNCSGALKPWEIAVLQDGELGGIWLD